MSPADQVTGQPVGTVAVIAGNRVSIGLLIIEIQEHGGNPSLGNLAVIGFGRLAQQDQPVCMTGSQEVGKDAVLFILRGQDLQQAEMPQIRQLLDQLFAEDGVIGIRLEILVRDHNPDFQMLSKD